MWLRRTMWWTTYRSFVVYMNLPTSGWADGSASSRLIELIISRTAVWVQPHNILEFFIFMKKLILTSGTFSLKKLKWKPSKQNEWDSQTQLELAWANPGKRHGYRASLTGRSSGCLWQIHQQDLRTEPFLVVLLHILQYVVVYHNLYSVHVASQSSSAGDDHNLCQYISTILR